MRAEEYLTILTDQIRCKMARGAVREEIRCHIEDQTAAFLSEGMEQAEAEEAAVREMGDPVETGNELNRIHRPRMAWGMIGLIAVLSLAGYLIQNFMQEKWIDAGEGAPYPALSVPCCFSGSAGNVNKRICELDLSPSDGRHAQSVLYAAYHSTGLRCGIVPVQRAGDERRAEGSSLDDPVGASHGMAAQYHPGGSAPADLSCGAGSGGVEEVVQSTEKAGPGRHCRLCRRDACSGWDIDLAVRRRLPEGEAESCAGSCRI